MITEDKEALVNVAIVSDGRTEIAIEALDDQIIIEEDKFKSGYECTMCDGESYLDETCDFCKGAGKENVGTTEERMCRMCCPPSLLETLSTKPGKKLCPTCKGQGSLIIAPQMSMRRPTSGVVKSIGPAVKTIKVGDRALYSMFAGTAINFKQKGTIRIMHEHEVMSRLHGIGKIGEWIR